MVVRRRARVPKYNLYDQIHGKLVVVDRETDPRIIEQHMGVLHKGSYWLCLCECGNLTYARTSDLIKGRKRSCGCLVSDNKKMLDLTGQKFGMLTALRKDRTPAGKSAWLCVCDCGESKIVVTTNLTSGNSTSCGCKKKRRGKERSKSKCS